MSEQCIQKAIDAGQGMVSRVEAEGLVKELMSANSTKQRPKDLIQGALDAAEQRRVDLAVAQRRKRNDLALRDGTRHRINAMSDLSRHGSKQFITPEEAVLNMLEGTVKGVDGGRSSIAQRSEGNFSRFMSDILGTLQGERSDLVKKLSRDQGFQDLVAAEMIEGGNAGMGEDAQYVARLLSDVLERVRQEVNDKGGNIGKLDEWATPQRHNVGRMLRAGEDAWVKHIAPLLRAQEGAYVDLDGLRKTYRKIVTGVEETGDDLLEKPFTQSQGRSVNKPLEQSRKLHFKNAAAWQAYNRQFGDGNIFAATVDYLKFTSNILAVRDVLGSNPKEGLGRIVDDQKQRIRQSHLDVEIQRDLTRSLENSYQRGRIDTALNIATRAQTGIGSERMAAVSSGIRTVENLALLGGAVWNALFGDLATSLSNARFHDVPFLTALNGGTIKAFSGTFSKEDKRLAYLLGAGFDGITGYAGSRFDSNDSIHGVNAQINEAFFKVTALTQATEMQRAAQARMYSQVMGGRLTLEHEKLSPKYKRLLSSHGIGKRQWNAIRSLVHEERDGQIYVLPSAVRGLDNNIADDLISKASIERAFTLIDKKYKDKNQSSDVKDQWLERERNRVRTELETRLAAMFTDETTFAVLKTDNYSARWTTFGQKDGTLVGTAMRLLTQMKGFAAAFSNRSLGRARFFSEASDYRARSMLTMFGRGEAAYLLTLTTLAGAASYTVKELARGNTAPDFSKKENIMTAVVMGGGLGVFGDFFAANENRYGRGVLEATAGPSASLGKDVMDIGFTALRGDVDKAGRDAAKTGLRLLPFQNFWMTRAALDNLVMDNIRTALDPRYHQKKNKRLNERGQQPIFDGAD